MTGMPRSKPPVIPGYHYERGIGAGGFADVFLYTQTALGRPVAVKVLRREHLTDESRRQFATEATVMAEVSHHPYIVMIHTSELAPDGRPFLVMEYYPEQHFGHRARDGRLSVADVLRVGVQVASAIETAHRAGILHRDIKPANILTNGYGKPGLTDFGIAGVQRNGSVSDAGGLSPHFAPPEVLEGRTGDERADVYSFAATLYALLTGRAPFYAPDGDNSFEALVRRVVHDPVPPMARPDVPPSLEHLVAYGLAKDSAHRPQTAVALARSLQDIERELRLPVTPIEVSEPVHRVSGSAVTGAAAPSSDATDDPTKFNARRPAVPIRPEPAPAPATTPATPPVAEDVPTDPAGVEDATILRAPVPAPARTVNPDVADAKPVVASGASRRRGLIAVVAGATIATAVVIGAIVALTRNDAPAARAPEQPLVNDAPSMFTDVPQPPTGVTVRAGTDSAGTRTLTVSWDASPDGAPDAYRLRRVDDGHDADEPTDTDDTTVVLPWPAGDGDRPCVQVHALRNSRLSSPSPRACLEPTTAGTAG